MNSGQQRKKIVLRPLQQISPALADFHPILQRILAARGITAKEQLAQGLTQLPSPWLLLNMEKMVSHLVAALTQQKKIVIVADFDADGATSCAVALQGLQLLGFKHLDFVVPNRFEYGYGLTPEIVALVKQLHPDIQVIITVDNGISSISGVDAANALGISVLVTDHHLAPKELPAADAIVNPNLPHSEFPSQNLAGVGVIFYVLIALRERLRALGYYQNQSQPNLAQLLDYVALGTVSDVVKLDQVNRILVHQGLARIRKGQAHIGILALTEISGRNPQRLNSADLGFALGPRLNAAGRMDDMSIGIKCLLSSNLNEAKKLAQQLETLNNQRKEVEAQMKQEALGLLEEQLPRLNEDTAPNGVCLFNQNWHQGVIGILAARIKERLHRPVIAFAPIDQDEMKGSARSIEGVHIRDVLADVATLHPKLLSKFGGHAMAAGLSLKIHDLPTFALAFDAMVSKRLVGVDLQQKIYSDGELSEQELNLEFAQQLQNLATWGQGFPEPQFHGIFDLIQCRIVGQQHLKLVLRQPFGNLFIDAIAFFVDAAESWLGTRQINAVYKLDINEYRDQSTLQLQIQYLEKIH